MAAHQEITGDSLERFFRFTDATDKYSIVPKFNDKRPHLKFNPVELFLPISERTNAVDRDDREQSVAPLAQLAEQVTLNHWVAGSIPARCILPATMRR